MMLTKIKLYPAQFPKSSGIVNFYTNVLNQFTAFHDVTHSFCAIGLKPKSSVLVRTCVLS